MEISEKALSKMRKLLALAERGVGGEKETAARMLKGMLRKHGLEISDLVSEKKEIHFFHYANTFEHRLAAQISAKVHNSNDWDVCCLYTGRGKTFGVKMDAAQLIEFELYWGTYRKALKEHFSAAYLAFVYANEIFGDGSQDKSDEPSPLTVAQRAGIKMAGAVEPTPVHKQIGFKG